ncbi:MAG: hypothetical protein AB1798_11880 [Spirochaetota bacterium]
MIEYRKSVNPDISKKLLLVIFVSYAITYIFYFAVSLFSFPLKSFLQTFFWQWVFDNSTISFIDAIIPVHCTSVILSYSLFFTSTGTEKTGTGELFYKIVKNSLILFLGLTLVYSVLTEGLKPILYRRQNERQYKSEISREFDSIAQKNFKEGNLEKTRQYLELYLTLNPSDAEALELFTETQQRLLTAETEQEERPPVEEKDTQMVNLSVLELIEKAQKFLETGDYLSAHYYASLAIQLDNTRDEAKRIASTAFKNISKVPLNKKEEEDSIRYRQKTEALNTLLYGDDIKAYYLFTALDNQYPNDPDIQKYLQVVKDKISTLSFFLQEAEQVKTLPGKRDILFVNQQQDAKEIIYIKKMITVKEGTYFQGIEAINFNSEGEINYHLTAPYGKMIDDYVNLLCIDKNNPKKILKPVFIEGQEPEEVKNMLKIYPKREEIGSFSLETTNFANFGLPQLWSLEKIFDKYGYLEGSVEIEIIMKILKIFSFLILSLLSVSTGWALRLKSNQRKSFLYFMFIPIIPFIINLVIIFYFYMHRILFVFMLLAAGYRLSLLVLVILEGILITLSLIFLAGQSTE